jgi:hypothetical protein
MLHGDFLDILLSHVNEYARGNMTVKATEKKLLFFKLKNRKKRRLFSIPKPIPTENRHLSKKPIPDPLPMSKSQARRALLCAIHPFYLHERLLLCDV